MSELTSKRCVPCEGGVKPLTETEIATLLQKTAGWQYDATEKNIYRDFQFTNYYETIAFVNAIAWMSHAENHHPDLAVGYRHCAVRYQTHAIGGLSENDFICAAKVNRLFRVE